MFTKSFFFCLFISCSKGYFQWSNCGLQKKYATDVNLKNSTDIHYAHGCEDGAPVILSCKDGYKIAVQYAFFGHGYHGNKDTCDSDWLGQRCHTRGVARKVKYLCQNKQRCVIRPNSEVLGITSCTFGLDADLHIRYTCNKDYSPETILINSVELSPSPLYLPGKLNVSASLTIKRYLPGSTKLKLKIQRNVVGIWTTVPCVMNFGSCTYENFCQMLRKVMFAKCDDQMEAAGIPCDCPFPTGTFTLPKLPINITSEQISKIPVPNFLVNGKYYLKAEFLDVYDRHLGCFEVYVQVHINGRKKRSIDIQQIQPDLK